MINRELIRMKTVQLLYSYLLVEKPFVLETQPSEPTKEKRFAYNLYIDMLYLMSCIANHVIFKNKRPLEETKFIKKIRNTEILNTLKAKYNHDYFPFEPVLNQLSEDIKDSLLFKELIEEKDKDTYVDKFWEDIFNSYIILNPDLNKIIRQLPEYTLSGTERMRAMMNETFKNFYSSGDNLDEALRTLEFSLNKARDLYIRLLALPVELTQQRLEDLKSNRRKIFATTEDLNPNMKMVQNEMVKSIETNPIFIEYTDKHKLSWKEEDPELLDNLLKAILESEIYKAYEKDDTKSLKKDSEFWYDIYVDIIFNNADFLEYLENKSVFWNDDLEIIGSFVLKTIRRMDNPKTAPTAVLPMYKDGENGRDAKFGAELFNYVVTYKDTYKEYIEEVLSPEKWKAERLAFMDIVITMTALAEILNYPEIPLQVSINEYIEIAKSYSSQKSGQFINGLLSAILAKLREEGKVINK